MGINKDRYHGPASRADAGGVAIKTSVGFSAIAHCLQAIKDGKPIPDDEIARIKKMSAELEAHFDDLSGWSADG